MADWPVSASVLGDLEALGNHKRRVFEKIDIRLPRGGYVKYNPEGLGGEKAHPYQAKAHFPGRFLTHQVLACGRRGGKTMFDIAEALAMMAIGGTMTWVGAPTYKLTDRVFKQVYKYVVIEKIFGVSPVIERNSSAERYIEMPWGSSIEGKSAERPESSKGESLDLFIDDECAEHDEEFFTEYVDAGLADRQGRAIFTSTPLGLTWFHKYFKRGQDAKNHPTWASHTWKSMDNPHLDQAWLERKKKEVSNQVWRQEYCAEFLARSGLVWEDYRDEYFDGPNSGHLFNPDRHPLNSAWTHYRGIDIGTNHPAACVWGAVDPSGNIWVYDEYCTVKPLHEEHAQAIAARTHEMVTGSIISWEAHAGHGTGGQTALEIYQSNGVYCSQAPKGLQLRVDAVSSYLRAALQDSATHGGLYVSDKCRALRAQIKTYRHKDQKPNTEVSGIKIHNKGRNDDLCDALGHLCVTKPTYAVPWMSAEVQMDEIERYGYQGTAMAMQRGDRNHVGLPGIATLPKVDRW